MRKASLESYQVDTFRELESGQFEFNPDFPVSKKSRFGDPEWDYTGQDNVRLKVLNKSKLFVDWARMILDDVPHLVREKRNTRQRLFEPKLPWPMIEDLKRAFLIIALFPSLIRGKTKRDKKGNTIVHAVFLCANFLTHLYIENLLPHRLFRITKLSDITLADLQRSITTYPYRLEGLKSVLMSISSEAVQINLKHGRLQWTHLDVKTLHWPQKRECENIPTLPDRLFALLSSTSADLLHEFHGLLGNETHDRGNQRPQPESRHQWPRFREMYESYVARREIIRHKGAQWASSHTPYFVKNFGTEPRAVREFLFEVQTAAFQIILLYTGMRYSEAASLQVGCLTVRGGTTLIKSTLIKNVPSNLPIDSDEWVAIGIVQDAVRALEEISRCNFNKFLFANLDTVKAEAAENPISNTCLTERLNLHLDKFDGQETWRSWKLSPHQYRHGLVHQLARAEVGIPYITRQLKHYHSLLSDRSYRINQTSTIYGMQKQRLIANATGLNALKEANVEIAMDLYGEGRRFAGGGAALHVKRTEAFFRGIGLEGKAREQYIEKFGACGGTEIRTGAGFCLRNHVDPQKLAEAPPPCIGDLQCNPHTCVYSVVPEGRTADVLARYRYAAKQLDSPDQSHLRSHWEAELHAYGAMLHQLGVNPQSLPHPSINSNTIAKVLAV